jgi:hypothetical protein
MKWEGRRKYIVQENQKVENRMYVFTTIIIIYYSLQTVIKEPPRIQVYYRVT